MDQIKLKKILGSILKKRRLVLEILIANFTVKLRVLSITNELLIRDNINSSNKKDSLYLKKYPQELLPYAIYKIDNQKLSLTEKIEFVSKLPYHVLEQIVSEYYKLISSTPISNIEYIPLKSNKILDKGRKKPKLSKIKTDNITDPGINKEEYELMQQYEKPGTQEFEIMQRYRQNQTALNKQNYNVSEEVFGGQPL